MPAFKRFGPGDQVDNVLVLQPRYDLVSGSEGWRGSPNSSSSLSLYGGARRGPTGGIFSAIQYESHAPNVGQTGHPTRGQPLTASVDVVWMTDEELNLSQRSRNRWGREHWDTVQRLYQDYQALDPDYVTASYDYYSLYFNKDSLNIVVNDVQDDASNFLVPSASFTFESWIKPFITSSATNDFTIQAFSNNVWFGITGSSGRLAISSSIGVFATSSIDINVNRWNHVAFSYDSFSKTGSFFINMAFAGTLFSPSGTMTDPGAFAYMGVGNQVLNDLAGFTSAAGSPRRAFHGLIGECRYWEGARTYAELSASAFSRLTGSSAAVPLAYLMFNEGPLTGRFGTSPQQFTAGSGALDYAGRARQRQGAFSVARLVGFDDRVGPVWHPNDNTSFFPTKVRAIGTVSESQGSGQNWGPIVSSDLERMLVVDIPSAFYGRQVVPGSIRMVCRAFESFGFVRTVVDDGRGGLYISGSVCSSSIDNREDYAGVGWNKVGNVFYGEGLIVIKDPALLDFGRTDGAALLATDTFALSFNGDSRIPVKTLMCRVDRGEFNATNNPTFRTVDADDGSWDRRHTSGNVRVTTVGLYNADRELVGVARLADPVRLRARDKINLKIRLDW